MVGIVALDAGINLFFLLFGTMVCLLGAGIALSELGLSGLRVRRVLPTAVHAGTPYLMGISLENRKRRVPSFSIEVEDLVDGEPIDKRCYFLKLPSLRTQETAYRHTPPRRGRHRLTGFRLVTKFPFGLIQRAREIADPAELLVYPALILPPVSLVRASPPVPARGATAGAAARGSSPACAPTATATIRATSTGARARGAGSPSCASTTTRRPSRRRWSSTTPRRGA